MIVVTLKPTAKPLFVPALAVGVAFAVVVTLWLEVASSETAPEEVSAPLVVTAARVVAMSVVTAIAAALVCGPAAVAAPIAASVAGFSAAPGAVEIAVVVIVLFAVAWTSMLADCVTVAASSISASVVIVMTGIATVVPIGAAATTPLAIVATVVFVIASTRTAPPAAIDALSDTRLRAVLLIDGWATATSAAAIATAFAVTVALIVEIARAVTKPDAVIVELPLIATSAVTPATSTASGIGGIGNGSAGFVTFEKSVACASSVTFAPTMFALAMFSVALTVGAMPVSGVPSVPSCALALSVTLPAVSVVPGVSVIVSALRERAAPRLTRRVIVIVSLPPPPLIVSEPVIEPNDWLSNVPLALRMRMPAPPISSDDRVVAGGAVDRDVRRRAGGVDRLEAGVRDEDAVEDDRAGVGARGGRDERLVIAFQEEAVVAAVAAVERDGDGDRAEKGERVVEVGCAGDVHAADQLQGARGGDAVDREDEIRPDDTERDLMRRGVGEVDDPGACAEILRWWSARHPRISIG